MQITVQGSGPVAGTPILPIGIGPGRHQKSARGTGNQA
jgi:hypothetical protein